MLYTSIDELEHFSFHDAEFSSMETKENNIIWKVTHLNATTENTQNTHPTDMRIVEAEIVFQAVEIKSILFSEFKEYNTKNELIRHEKPREANVSEFATILNESMAAYCKIQSMRMTSTPTDEDRKYSAVFWLDGGAGVFDLSLEFEHVVISWNEYGGKAWYVDHIRKNPKYN